MGREYQDVEIRRNGVLNTTDLKFFNEPARHKLLDIVGDLALVGRPIKGHILAARPGPLRQHQLRQAHQGEDPRGGEEPACRTST